MSPAPKSLESLLTRLVVSGVKLKCSCTKMYKRFLKLNVFIFSEVKFVLSAAPPVLLEKFVSK